MPKIGNLSPLGRIRGRSRTAAACLSLLAGAGLVAGCGSSGGSGSPASSTFVAAIPALPPTLDPTSFSGGTRPAMSFLDSFLFDFESTSCTTSLSGDKLVGNLAKSWTQSPDKKSYDIVLNDYKSSYGNPLTAQDVKWSVDYAIANSPISKYLASADAHFSKTPVTVVSDHEFKLNVDQATPDDLALFAIPTFTIFDSTEIKKHATQDDPWGKKWVAQNAAVFGPWKLDSFDPGNQMTLSANEGYTGSRGKVAKLIVKQVAGASDQSQLLQQGSINYANAPTWTQYKDLMSNSKVKVYPCAPLSRDVLILNFNDKALGNVKVRQAISMAINRDELNKSAYAGLATPSTTALLPSEMPPNSDSVPKYTYNVSAAKQLLAEAGFPNGLDLTLSYNENQPGSQVTQSSILIQNQLKQIGINVKLNHVANGNDFNSQFQEGKYQSILYYSGAALPSTYFDVSLESPDSPNVSWGFKDQQFSALVHTVGASEPGSPEYNEALVKIAQYNATQFPWIPLVDTPNIFAMNSNAGNVDQAVGPITPRISNLNK
ncbi:ABC transporter substrate-binding protein [Amycolatopsis balhimycina]|nr:ABC transporter substrate-binding protein [Amycolatopsis balhimycina]